MKAVILIGAGCPRELAARLCQLGVPVMTTWQGIDLVPEDAPVFVGRPGVIGQRAANIIQQRAEAVYIFGARMDGEQVGHRMDNFAPRAVKTVYDIDPAELDKLPPSWNRIQQDLTEGFVIPAIEADADWMAWCSALYARFRPELDGNGDVDEYVDPYYFTRRLGEVCEEGEVIVPASSGMQSCSIMQAWKVKRGQKILLVNTTGAMGFEPMAIGAAIATGRRVVCVAGDGGFFLNIQELEIVKRLDLPIKYFVFCNGGYGSIKTMQDARFGLRVGADEGSGFTLPNLERTAAVWNFPFHRIRDNADCDRLGKILDAPGASITQVDSSMSFIYACKVNASLNGNAFTVDDMADMTPRVDYE